MPLCRAHTGGDNPGGDNHGGKRTRGHGKQGAPIWIIGWLFTLGFAELSFWKGVLALFIWPYYLGGLLGTG